MNPIISKTLGGLSNEYYFRNFLLGLIIPIVFYFVLPISFKNDIGPIIFAVISSLLYPYSRFVYEKIMGFILGENTYFVNGILMLITKFITMYFCWAFAILVAPLGMLYLYFYHTKNEN
jgi:hypothetical protein